MLYDRPLPREHNIYQHFLTGNFSDHGITYKMDSYFTTAEICVGATLLVILMLLALLGNLLTCFVFCNKTHLRNATNVSIFILAISDVLSAVLVMPFSLASFISGKWILWSSSCVFNAYVINALLGLTFISMTCTAVVRYVHVVRASLQHHLRPKRTSILISTLWLLYLILITIPVFIEFPEGKYSEKRAFCRLQYNNLEAFKTVRVILLTLGGVFSLVIVIAYYKVFRFVSHHNQAVAPNLQQEMSSHIEETKITKTLAIVVIAFVLCWFPTGIVEAVTVNEVKVPPFVRFLQTIFIFASSAINPFIYIFTNRRFKREYVEVLRGLLLK